MRWFGLSLCLLVGFLSIFHTSSAYPRVRRQIELQDNSDLSPLSEDNGNEDLSERDKRTLEPITQSKYGVKNAILGLIFGKINSFIDAKTRLVDTWDKQNIEKNKMYGIEPPQSGAAGLGNVVSSIIGPKLQLLGPKIGIITGALGSLSGGSSGNGDSSSGGSGLGSILRIITSLSGGSSGGDGNSGDTQVAMNKNNTETENFIIFRIIQDLMAQTTTKPQSFSAVGKKLNSKTRPKSTTTTEPIPVFDRNKVSLQFPGELFGSSLTLLLRSTKIIGSVIENSAQRYQSFLRLFRPLFKGQFEIKGLDPVTTTTERPPRITTVKDFEALSSETTTAFSNNIR